MGFHTRMIRLFSLGLLLIHSFTFAATLGGVQDGGTFFSKDVVKRANEEIKEIKKLFKRDIIIETVKEVPVSNEKNLDNNSKDVDPLFSQWAKKRLAKTGANNIYIVISRKPSYIMAAVGNDTRTKGVFTEEDRNGLIRLVADNFQQRDYNKGLLDAIRFVRGSMDHNINGAPAMMKPEAAASAAAPDVTFLWRWIGFGCAALLALLLVTGLVRGFNAPVTPTQENNPT